MMFAVLGVFSGMSLNLLLQFATGIHRLVKDNQSDEEKPDLYDLKTDLPLVQMACLFTAILVFWSVFFFLLRGLSGGFLEYFLVFPLSCLICMGVETGAKFLLGKKQKDTTFTYYSAATAYDGLAALSFVLISRLARNFSDGIFLGFFFVLGCLLVSIIISEIKRRAFLENVPHYLKGSPLALISMCLLSMIFSAIAGVLLRLL